MTEARSSPFSHPGFTVYWVGGLCSNTGTWLHSVTAGIVVLQLTGSPFMVGVLNFAAFAPIFALSFVSGVASDRSDRRRIVIGCSVLSALASGGLTVLALTGHLTTGWLIAVSAVLGSSYAFAKPALSALLPALVGPGDLAHATAINTLQFTIGQVVGSTLSAILLQLADPGWAFAANTMTFAGPILSMLLLRPLVTQQTPSSGSGTAALVEGLAFVGRKGGMLALMVAIVLANGVVEAMRTLAPAFAERAVGGSAEDAGLLVAGISIGSVLGAISYGVVARRLGRAWLVMVGFGLEAVGVVACALAPTLLVAVLAAVPMGLGFSYLIPILSATMQERSPDALRGRVMSAFAMAHLGLRPLLSLLAGALGSLLGIRIALGLFLACTVLGAFALRGGRAVLTAVPIGERDRKPLTGGPRPP